MITVYSKDNPVKESVFTLQNATKVGNIKISKNGIANEFSTSNYIVTNFPFSPSGTWEWNFKVRTGSNLEGRQQIIGAVTSNCGGLEFGIMDRMFEIWLSTTSSYYDIASPAQSSSIVEANTEYYIKVSFNGSVYKYEYSLDGESYTTAISVSSTSKIYGEVKGFGCDPYQQNAVWTGSIDLTQTSCKIDNTIYTFESFSTPSTLYSSNFTPLNPQPSFTLYRKNLVIDNNVYVRDPENDLIKWEYWNEGESGESGESGSNI